MLLLIEISMVIDRTEYWSSGCWCSRKKIFNTERLTSGKWYTFFWGGSGNVQ